MSIEKNWLQKFIKSWDSLSKPKKTQTTKWAVAKTFTGIPNSNDYEIQEVKAGEELHHITGSSGKDSKYRTFHNTLMAALNYTDKGNFKCADCNVLSSDFVAAHVRVKGEQNIFLIRTCRGCNSKKDDDFFKLERTYIVTKTNKKRLDYL